jgi:hypothetical protein
MYTKVVSEKEYQITAIASKLEVGSQLLYADPLPDGMYAITSERYPVALYDLYQERRYAEHDTYLRKARVLLQKLHQEGIYLRSISEDNVVCDPITNQVRLVNFRQSYFGVDVMRPIDVEYYQDLYQEGVRYAGEPTTTLDYLSRLELGCLESLRWKH